MMRKVVKHGPTTLTVSLPAKWCRSNNIREGGQLDLNEEAGRLVILAGKADNENSIEIDVSDCDRIIYDIIGACFKKGYDKVIVKYNKPSELEIIQDVSNVLYGYGITEERKGQVIITELSSLKEEKFEVIVRRIFYYLEGIIKDGFDAMSAGDFSFMQTLVLRDKELTKLCDFARRSINKMCVDEKSPALYNIAEQLEKIGDAYKHLLQELIRLKHKPSAELLKHFGNSLRSFESMNKIFYNFSLKEAKVFYSFKKEIEDMLQAQKKSEETEFFTLLIIIMSLLYDIKGSILVYKL